VDDAVSSGARPSALAALLYLYRHSAVNRLRRQLARVRNPRYLLAMVLGALYLWWALVRNPGMRADQGPFRAAVGADGVLLPFLAVGLLLAAAWWWLASTDRSAIAFSPAEVQFLFPAPVSRRTLVHAKLLRAQFGILVNVLVWTVLLRGGASGAAWERGLALWLLFSTITLHRLGATLVRSNVVEHARAGRRRALLSIAVFVALLAALVAGLLPALPALRAAADQGIGALARAAAAALDQPLPRLALWPATALLAPVFTTGTATWLARVPAALAVCALHYAWVMRMDAAFEEAALEASQHRAERIQRVKAQQLGKARARSGRLAKVPALPVRGRPEAAIAWKNVAAALRGGGWRAQFLVFTLGLVGFGLAVRQAADNVADAIAALAVAWGAMLLFIGPLWLRFDLRLDLQRLDVLKALPIPGRRLVAAEIAGVTLLHSITVWGLLAAAGLLLAREPGSLDQLGLDLARALAVVIAVPAMNALMFTVYNGTALLFPAWVRLGSENRGFESMGQNLLTMGATTIVGAVALVFPVGVALIVLWLGPVWIGAWAAPLAALLAAGVLLLELWPLVWWLGDVFDRLDVTDVPAGP
jgi:hypothetical protein